MMRVAALTLALAALAAPALAAPAAEEITALPGFNGTLPSKHYSGYLSVGGGKQLHYWLQMAESNPSTAPVVLWLNGGPGCSSLDGQFYEMGAIHFVNPEQSTGLPDLKLNPYRWTKEATMLFLEAPAGVGFSYQQGNGGLYFTDDTQTAEDNWEALHQFFSVKFPELRQNDFFISGESYAGYYVPMLATQVYDHNQAGNFSINLKGVAVGDGCTTVDPSQPNAGPCSGAYTFSVDMLHGHGLFADSLYRQITQTCKDPADPSEACEELLNKMSSQVGRVNIYNVYAKCIEGGSRTRLAWNDPNSRARRIPRRKIDEIFEPEGPVGCIDGLAAGAYLNQPEVRKALHVESEETIGTWTICSNKVDYTSNVKTVLPLWPTLVKNYQVLIYSGDVDACVPYVATESWTTNLGFPVEKEWRPWTLETEFGDQVAGYAITFGSGSDAGPVNGSTDFSFRYVTVHGAGHMVPQASNDLGRPEAAYTLFTNFINNKEF